MAKRDNSWTKNKMERFLREGRGSGEGENYKPWLTIQDYPSLGRATRILGAKTKRIHQLHTDSQLKYLYLLEWEESVIDIREHFPLLDFDTVVHDKNDLNLKLFRDKDSGEQYVICTTFLITLRDGNGKTDLVARSIKSASELDKKSSLEKLEIERRYWKAKGIDFGVVTNKDIPSTRAKNIEWMHSVLTMEEHNDFRKDELNELSYGLLNRFSNTDETIRKVVSQFERDYGLESGSGLFLFKYLIAKKRIMLDMNEVINTSKSCSCLSMSEINQEVKGENEICS